jgi:hypothetical protein
MGVVRSGLMFEPGPQGMRTAAPLPAGGYLLVVDTDGPWAINFSVP